MMKSLFAMLCLFNVNVGVLFAADEESTGTRAPLPADFVRFPSPDGRFALFMGWGEERHYDASTNDWVVDKKMAPAAIIERVSQKVLFAFKTPGDPDEDKALWSADSKMLAYSLRGNTFTELRVFSCGDDSVREVELPYLGEIELEMKPAPRSRHRNAHEHLDYDKELPVRWLETGALAVSQERAMTDPEGFTYTRAFLFTLAFDAAGKATIAEVKKQKQKVTSRPAK